MRTKIKTKDLLKVINPFSDGITYNGQQIHPSLHELKKYVDEPTENNLFEKSDDLVVDFYKNLALYVLNSTNNPKYISLNLDKENPFESGLFEYLTNIYKDTPFTYLDLESNTNNDILIKSKKLTDITDELKFNEVEIVKASDTYMSGYTAIFNDSTKIVENNKFFWKNDSHDLYSDIDFLLEKIDAIRYTSNESKDIFYSLLKMAKPEIIASDEFKLALLSSERNQNLQIMLMENNEPSIFSIDFSEPIIQDFVLARIKEGDFNLLTIMMQEYFGVQSQKEGEWNIEGVKQHALNNENINWSLFLNQPETVKHLVSQPRGEHYYGYYSSDNNFTVLNCYPFFDDKNKRDPSIINKYIERITVSNSFSSQDKINQDKLFELPIDLFQEEFFIDRISSNIDFYRLKNKLVQLNIAPTVLADPEFIIKKAKMTEHTTIANWINNFLDKHQINKEFLTEILIKNSDFFNSMFQDKKYKKYCGDFDLISVAHNRGFSLSNLNTSFIAKELIKESNNPVHESLKVEAVIEKSLFNSFKELYEKPEDIAKFKEKFIKPEYAFIRTKRSASQKRFYDNEQRAKMVGKLKTREAVFNTLKRVGELTTSSYMFQADQFYQSLNSHLKKDVEIVERIMQLGGLQYGVLDDSLKYNSSLALKFLHQDITSLEHIRKEFFNDINFSLEFAKIMDENGMYLNAKIIPPFVAKFFENQEITEGYYSYLSKYLTFNSLKDNVTVKNEPPAKKIKI